LAEFNGSIIPNGVLVAIGGNEDKEHDLDILRELVSLVDKPVIEVITTASEIPEESGHRYEKAFEKIGDNSFQLMHIRTREEAVNEDYVRRIKDANIIFFTGGDQLRITSILGGSHILNTIVEKYHREECIIAGTSAGASAMSETMIYGGESSEALLKGTVNMTAGIGLVKNIIIDSHFIKRGRFSRLMQIVSSNPGHIGLGLGEDTGVIMQYGQIIRAFGSGLVVIFDGQHIRYTNITTIDDNEAIAVENVHVHTLVKGHGYDLSRRKYLKPSDMQCLSLTCP
jgi:cyanophycinase